MNLTPELMWFAVFIWLAFTTEIATGFGSIIIALALGALVLPIEFMLPVLVTLNVIMNSVFLSRLFKQIDQAVFLKQIFPLMFGGMVVGIALFPVLPEHLLKIGFAILVIWFAAKSLFFTGLSSAPKGKLAEIKQKVWIGLGGITHGLYASGGPLLVSGLAASTMSKSAFRATLLATWCSLNFCYMAWFAYNGALQTHISTVTLMLPVLLFAAISGQFIHHKVNETQFKKLIFGLLLVCGLVMLGQAI